MKAKLTLAVFAAFMMFTGSVLAGGEQAIRLGCALPLSGRLEHSGKLYRQSYDLAAEWINRHGGITVGGEQHRVEIIYYDDLGDPSRTAFLYETLISKDKVHFLLGPFGGAAVLAAAAIAEKLGTPLVQGSAATPEIYEQGYRFVFGILPVAKGYFTAVLDFMAGLEPVPRKLGLVYNDDRFDRDIADGLLGTAPGRNFEVVFAEKYVPGTKDFAPLVSGLKAAKPDAVLIPGYVEESRLIISQMREQGLRPKMIVLTVQITEDEVRGVFGETAENLFAVSSWYRSFSLTGEVFGGSGEFVRLYTAAYGENPDYHAAGAAAVLAVYKAAIEKAGSLDGNSVRDALAGVSLDTVYGKVEFRPDGRIKGGEFILQIQGGVVCQVYPVREKKPVYPVPEWARKK